ncbi:ABC transporter ATP-binding protein [Butyrivibrio sp. MC2013]|uniref:ABC transporter ATP-binding protein n=1 Tax=Butyrivibrio sp. MC2013 TaxID=1280686 RepID=UPI0004054F49|nr:ABC transporter ATP-binding protein [Butyrivibrio sp. MC2013]
MIEIKDLSKTFYSEEKGQETKALTDLTLDIKEHQIFGLIGTNGAGKSTLMRIMAGVLLQDKGSMIIDNQKVFNNPDIKKDIFFVPDELYFLPDSTPMDMACYYKLFYPSFDKERCEKLLDDFGFDKTKKIGGFSKGMKRQTALILGICAGSRYLFLDETFDGLDPVVRQAVKSIFAGEIQSRDFTPVMTSHNLRELEDISDHVGLLHKGGVLLSEDIEDMKLELQKVQCVFTNESDEQMIPQMPGLISYEKRGRVYTITLRGKREDVMQLFRSYETIFFEMLPLTLEEIFISETKGAGYDVKKLIIE